MKAAALRFPAHGALLFDLDGTLIDTAADLGHAANVARAARGLPPLPLAQYRHHSSGGARALLKVGMNLLPGDADFEPLREILLCHYRENLAVESALFPGMDALLQMLEAQGTRWGVVTNKPGWLTRPLMDALDLSRRAACIISADDAPRAKPHPDTLMLALAQTGLGPDDAWYVGDDPRDIVAAQAAGMRSVVAGWGYVEESPPVTSWGADLIAHSVKDLQSHVASSHTVPSISE